MIWVFGFIAGFVVGAAWTAYMADPARNTVDDRWDRATRRAADRQGKS